MVEEGSEPLENATRMARYMLSMMMQANAVARMGDPFMMRTYF